MSQNINKAYKNYFEIETPEKYMIFLIVYMSAIKGPFGYLGASI